MTVLPTSKQAAQAKALLTASPSYQSVSDRIAVAANFDQEYDEHAAPLNGREREIFDREMASASKTALRTCEIAFKFPTEGLDEVQAAERVACTDAFISGVPMSRLGTAPVDLPFKYNGTEHKGLHLLMAAVAQDAVRLAKDEAARVAAQGPDPADVATTAAELKKRFDELELDTSTPNSQAIIEDLAIKIENGLAAVPAADKAAKRTTEIDRAVGKMMRRSFTGVYGEALAGLADKLGDSAVAAQVMGLFKGKIEEALTGSAVLDANRDAYRKALVDKFIKYLDPKEQSSLASFKSADMAGKTEKLDLIKTRIAEAVVYIARVSSSCFVQTAGEGAEANYTKLATELQGKLNPKDGVIVANRIARLIEEALAAAPAAYNTEAYRSTLTAKAQAYIQSLVDEYKKAATDLAKKGEAMRKICELLDRSFVSVLGKPEKSDFLQIPEAMLKPESFGLLPTEKIASDTILGLAALFRAAVAAYRFKNEDRRPVLEALEGAGAEPAKIFKILADNIIDAVNHFKDDDCKTLKDVYEEQIKVARNEQEIATIQEKIDGIEELEEVKLLQVIVNMIDRGKTVVRSEGGLASFVSLDLSKVDTKDENMGGKFENLFALGGVAASADSGTGYSAYERMSVTIGKETGFKGEVSVAAVGLSNPAILSVPGDLGRGTLGVDDGQMRVGRIDEAIAKVGYVLESHSGDRTFSAGVEASAGILSARQYDPAGAVVDTSPNIDKIGTLPDGSKTAGARVAGSFAVNRIGNGEKGRKLFEVKAQVNTGSAKVGLPFIDDKVLKGGLGSRTGGSVQASVDLGAVAGTSALPEVSAAVGRDGVGADEKAEQKWGDYTVGSFAMQWRIRRLLLAGALRVFSEKSGGNPSEFTGYNAAVLAALELSTRSAGTFTPSLLVDWNGRSGERQTGGGYARGGNGNRNQSITEGQGVIEVVPSLVWASPWGLGVSISTPVMGSANYEQDKRNWSVAGVLGFSWTYERQLMRKTRGSDDE